MVERKESQAANMRPCKRAIFDESGKTYCTDEFRGDGLALNFIVMAPSRKKRAL